MFSCRVYNSSVVVTRNLYLTIDLTVIANEPLELIILLLTFMKHHMHMCHHELNILYGV
jgi:hypothetical protein